MLPLLLAGCALLPTMMWRSAALGGPPALRMALDPAVLMKQSEVMEVLSEAADPALRDLEEPDGACDVVSLGLVRAVQISEGDDAIQVKIELPAEAVAAGAADRLRLQCTKLLTGALPWLRNVDVKITGSKTALQRLGASAQANDDATEAIAAMKSESGLAAGVGGVEHIIAVASCKGGVGKSTTAVNLACALAESGKRVGIVDLDIHGPSLPSMIMVDGQLQVDGEMLVPFKAHGLKLMSMGFINPGAMPLRGAKVTPIVQQLLGRTIWGELDYLIVDMPPGTGDVQLTLSQDFRVSAAVLVTTPQRLSFVDVVKGVEMFDKVGIPTIAVVENMAGIQTPPETTEELEIIGAKHSLPDGAMAELRELLSRPYSLFGASHVDRLQEMWGIRAAHSLPLLPEVARAADAGTPTFLSHPQSQAADTYRALSADLVREVNSLSTTERPALLYSSEERRVLIALADGTQQSISPRELRGLCRSPSNRPDNLPDDLEPLDFVPMGNYAVSVRWSDGHQSLLPYASFVEGY